MPRTRATLAAAVATATLGALVAWSPVASGAGVVEDGPTYQMPTVGECHLFKYADWTDASEPTAPVDCSAKHNALVIAVAELPADTDWAMDGTDLLDARTEHCAPAFKEALGKSYKVIARTGFTWTSWIPTEEQRAHGASWIRCDINLFGFKKALPLGSTPFLTSSTVPRKYQTCLLVEEDVTYFSSCGSAHNYVLDKVVTVPGAAFPSRATFMKFARQNCPASKGDAWWATWRGLEAWNAGDHTLVCYDYFMD